MISAEDKEIFQRIKQKSLLKTLDLEKNWEIFTKMKQAGEEILFSDFLVKRKIITLVALEENQVASPARKKLGSFELLSKLGSGGMGTVYLARKEEQKVAIKLLPRGKNADEKAIKRFNREFKTLNELSHKNIIRATERGFADSYNYYVMEYFECDSLKEFGLSHPASEHAYFLPFILQVAEALQFAAKQGILHRDIKPDNILVTKELLVKIIDFGLVKWEGQDVTELTRTQSTMGTPHFISPEQAKDSKNVDERADIYSLGATYYNLLTNDYPFKGNTPYEILSALLSNSLEEPKKLNPDIPDNVNALILKMMAKNIDERYLNWQAVIDDLKKCLSGRKISFKKPREKSIISNRVLLISAIILLVMVFLFPLLRGPKEDRGISGLDVSKAATEHDLELSAKEQEEAVEVKIVPYRIISNFDRKYRRDPVEKNAPNYFSHLDKKISWIAEQNVDESMPVQERLITICYQTLALTGNGEDFFTSDYKDKLLYNEKFILDSQISPGRWSSDIGINALCALVVIDMFAMHGSVHEELERIISFSLANLHKDLGENTHFIESDVEGADLIVLMVFASAKHCGSQKELARLPKEFQEFLFSEVSEEHVKKKPKAEQLYLHAISKWLFRTRDLEDLGQVFDSLKREKSAINLFYQSFIVSRAWKQNGVFKFIRIIAETVSDEQVVVKNQFEKFSKINGTIVTNALLILSYENFYRYPSFFVLQNDNKKIEDRFRELKKRRGQRPEK